MPRSGPRIEELSRCRFQFNNSFETNSKKTRYCPKHEGHTLHSEYFSSSVRLHCCASCYTDRNILCKKIRKLQLGDAICTNLSIIVKVGVRAMHAPPEGRPRRKLAPVFICETNAREMRPPPAPQWCEFPEFWKQELERLAGIDYFIQTTENLAK